MPKSLGYIYKIEHRTRTDTPVYYGSTTDLVKREKQHKYNCCGANYKKHNYYIYQFIRDFGGWENWRLIKLNEILFDDKKELKNLERMYIENHVSSGKKSLNQTIPNRTNAEWVKDNPEKVKNILVKGRLRNREKQNEYRRQHYHKNKERILQANKDYYQKNKDKINAVRKYKWTCMCGAEISIKNRKEHLKSDYHHTKALGILCEAINNF